MHDIYTFVLSPLSNFFLNPCQHSTLCLHLSGTLALGCAAIFVSFEKGGKEFCLEPKKMFERNRRTLGRAAQFRFHSNGENLNENSFA
jgi:hypothetical protein